MKIVTGILVILASVLGISSASAGQFTFAYINTNNCTRAQNEVMALSSDTVQVDAECSDYTPGGFHSNNGTAYDYRLYTKVTIAGTNYVGEQIQMNSYGTNDCTFSQNEIKLLAGSAVSVDTECSAYSPGGYTSADGKTTYDYLLTTTATLLK